MIQSKMYGEKADKTLIVKHSQRLSLSYYPSFDDAKIVFFFQSKKKI